MVHDAAKRFSIKPEDGIYIGDNDCDIELGKKLNGVTIHIKNESIAITAKPDYSVQDLEGAFQLLNTLHTQLWQIT